MGKFWRLIICKVTIVIPFHVIPFHWSWEVQNSCICNCSSLRRPSSSLAEWIVENVWLWSFEASQLTGHTFFPGDSSQVCKVQGEEFTCSTADDSINVTCDTSRCPLQGPPMAPIMESQLLTGWAEKCFNFFCKKRKELKLNGFESHPFLSKCVDITILTYYDYHHTAKVKQKINSQAVFTLFWQYWMQYLMRSTFIRASGGGRLWWHQPLIKCGVVPSTSLWFLLHPCFASNKVWPQPLPPVWWEAGRLWGSG